MCLKSNTVALMYCTRALQLHMKDTMRQWRTQGGVRVFKLPPPQIPKVLQKIVPNSTRL